MTPFTSGDFFEQPDWLLNTNSLNLYTTEDRVRKIRALAKRGKEACVLMIDALQKAATDSQAPVRSAALDALGLLDEDAPMELFLNALNDSDWDVRASAAQVLALVGSRVPSKPLVIALRHEKHEIVEDALIRTLGALHKEINLIKDYLKNGSNWMTRCAAAWALGAQGEDAPVQSLIEALSDPDEMVREAAARALGKVNSRQALPALHRTKLDRDEVVCEAARWALLQIYKHTQEPEEAQGKELPYNKDAEEGCRPDDSDARKHLSAGEPQAGSWFMLHALSEMIKERKGFLHWSDEFQTETGQMLLIVCGYQYTKDNILHSLKKNMQVKFSQETQAEIDELMQLTLDQAENVSKGHPFEELLGVSFLISRVDSDLRQKPPLHVVICGLGHSQVRRYDPPVFTHLVSKCLETADDPFTLLHPHDLIDLKIWYRPPEEEQILRLA